MFASGTHEEMSSSLESIGAACAIFDLSASPSETQLLSANSRFALLTDQPLDLLISCDLSQLFNVDLKQAVSDCLADCLSEGEPAETELRVERTESHSWYRLVASPVIDGNNRVTRILATFIDITEKKRLEKRVQQLNQRFEAVVDTAYDGIVSIDQDHKIRYMNASGRRMFGLEGLDYLGQSIETLIPTRFHHKHAVLVDQFAESSTDARPMESRAPVFGMRRDGTEFPAEVNLSTMSVDGHIEMTAVVRDISERARLMQELATAAAQDPLTGITNRRKGLELIQQEIIRSRRMNHPFSLAVIDIDYFKGVNDAHGHLAGDQVLIDFCSSVNAMLRETDLFCRWGGEEFIVVLPETPLHNGLIWAERLRERIQQSTTQTKEGKQIQFTISIGLTEWNADQDMDAVVAQADLGLYHAKRSGRNQVGVK